MTAFAKLARKMAGERDMGGLGASEKFWHNVAVNGSVTRGGMPTAEFR